MLTGLAFKEAKMPHAIEYVINGEELMKYLAEKSANQKDYPDVILLDLNMPKMDGRVALKQIKSDPDLCHLDILIFSTSISEEDKTYTLGLGAKKYLTKPSNFVTLVEMVKEICIEYSMITR